MNEEKALWNWTRALFYISVTTYVTYWIFMPVFETTGNIIALIIGSISLLVWFFLSIALIPMLILHLRKYEQKPFAVTALTITVVLFIFTIVFFILGIFYSYYDPIPSESMNYETIVINMENDCNSWCSEVDGDSIGSLDFDAYEEFLWCNCYDDSNSIIEKKIWPHEDYLN